VFAAYERYFDFQGRSRRAEFWLFMLWNLLIGIAAVAIDVLAFGTNPTAPFGIYGPVYVMVAGANFIPNLSVQVRRLHDTDRSGWWSLIVLIPLVGAIAMLVFNCLPGAEGANRFGGRWVRGEEDLEATFA
jgi:uncharacterized membrane protein YhaH (DUF805 family)